MTPWSGSSNASTAPTPPGGLDSGGNGLGLSIAAALTEAHGGTISAASPPGGGALFRIGLPVYSSSSSSAPAGR
ncbi:ATP-binding protein [Nonomuraea sp. NPDC003754]